MHCIKLPFKIAIFWNRVQTIFDFPRRLQKNVYIAKELVCGGNKVIGKLFHNSYIKLDKISNFSLRCIISFKIGTTLFSNSFQSWHHLCYESFKSNSDIGTFKICISLKFVVQAVRRKSAGNKKKIIKETKTNVFGIRCIWLSIESL